MHAMPWFLTAVGGAVLATALGAQPARERTMVAFDLETTGFSAEQDRVVEIAAVRFQGDREMDTRQWLIQPGRPIPPQAEAVHGITDADVANAPNFAAVYPEFMAFVGDAPLVAHQAHFDLRFLDAECRRHGLTPPTNRVIDSLRLARHHFPQAPGHRLEDLVTFLELPAGAYHRALDDARYLPHLLGRIFADHPELTWDALREVGEINRPPPPTPTP